MRIKIKDNASKLYYSSAHQRGYFRKEYYQMLKKVDGVILEVETEHLFKNQFNTPPIEGVTKLGLRVMEEYIEEVLEDERERKMRCVYCGKTQDVSTSCIECKSRQIVHLEPLSKSAEVSLDYMIRAKAERGAGGEVRINERIPTIAVNTSSGGDYFFQGEDAQAMITNFETEYKWLSCSIEDYILAVCQSW